LRFPSKFDSSLTQDIGPSMVHKINYESSIKWNTLVWVVCGFWGKPLELE